MSPPVRVAVLGAGMIGRRHIGVARPENGATLVAVVDPAPQSRTMAAELGVPWFGDGAAMLAAVQPEAAIVATPNGLHEEHGLMCVAAGVAALVEKPIAATVEAGARLVAAAERAGVPLLVGHHRRHNPLVAAARAAIDGGRIGRVVAVQATSWFAKPTSYFDVAWRRAPGAGPVLLNLIHDLDLVRHLCGDVVSVQAMESRAVRGFAVEDTAVALLRFASGALGTLTLSDTIVAPWSWEMTSGENPDFHGTGEACLVVGGTAGSLSVPHLDVWSQAGAPDWFQPVERVRLLAGAAVDPFAAQMRNLCDVVRGRATAVAPGAEGLATLRVLAAIKQAAADGGAVVVA